MECLEVALALDGRWGIWGGTTRAERGWHDDTHYAQTVEGPDSVTSGSSRVALLAHRGSRRKYFPLVAFWLSFVCAPGPGPVPVFAMSVRHVAILVAASPLLFACGPSASELQDQDPEGYMACSAFGRSLGAGGSGYTDAVGEAAEAGLRSSDEPIRAQVDDRNGGADGSPLIRDLGDFRSACEDAGFDFN